MQSELVFVKSKRFFVVGVGHAQPFAGPWAAGAGEVEASALTLLDDLLAVQQ